MSDDENGIDQLPYEQDDDGRYRAVLPSGKRPVIKPVLALKIRRVYETYPQPPVPQKLLEIENAGVAQKVDTPGDPEYRKQLTDWYGVVLQALFVRFVLDALVVPDDDEWAWKLQTTGIPVPESGPERQWAYVEEELEELVTSYEERVRFTEAVRAISVPTEAGIRAARRRFRDKVEEPAVDDDADAEGGGDDDPGGTGAGSG